MPMSGRRSRRRRSTDSAGTRLRPIETPPVSQSKGADMPHLPTPRAIAVTAAVLITTGLIGSPALAKKPGGLVDPALTNAQAIQLKLAPSPKTYP
jgi:hypothetical protein